MIRGQQNGKASIKATAICMKNYIHKHFYYESLTGCVISHRLGSHIRYNDISYAICDRQSGIGAGLSANAVVGAFLYHVTVIVYH
jgi:hypothetical protein